MLPVDYDYEYDYYDSYEEYDYGEYDGNKNGENDNSSFYVSRVTVLGIAAGDGNVAFVEKMAILALQWALLLMMGDSSLLCSYLVYTEIIRMLHAAGASISAEDSFGYHAINNAAAYGELEAVETLIELGAGKDIPNEFAKVYKELFNREHDENEVNSILNKLNLDITAESLQNVDKINTVTIKEALDKIKPKKSDPTWDFSSDFLKRGPDLLWKHLELMI